MADLNSPGHLHKLAVKLSYLLHKRFIFLLIASYAVAAFVPGLGLWIRDCNLGRIALIGQHQELTLPALMLSLLLINAGLGIRSIEFQDIVHKPFMVLTALCTNLAAPVLFLFTLSRLLGYWHNSDEMQNILVGLAIVVSMPIAGSSTAWSQNANGNLALSVTLVLLSTILSPFITPLGLEAGGMVTHGDYAYHLRRLAESGSSLFLLLYSVVPVLLGLTLRRFIGELRLAYFSPYLKLANSVNLLLLIYSNASVSLPQAVAKPDWDFLLLILAITVALCILMFSSGWLVARACRVPAPDRISLLFALGMNNNGTGLVLASLALADHPSVLLPIIFYNLVQHLAAGCVDFIISRSNGQQPTLPPAGSKPKLQSSPAA